MTAARQRIVILGANGNVGTEITLILRNFPEYDTVPVCRSKQGSSFLRYMGVPCAHGVISDPAQAAALLSRCSVIANFALAYSPTGSPRELSELNRQIITNIFTNAPRNATVLHFSTISVYGDGKGGGRLGLKSSYGAAKAKDERVALECSRKTGTRLYVLRLGHVLGDLQNLSRIITDEIATGSANIPFPGRASNTTFTATIVDAIIKAAHNELGRPGVYDLLNSPQLSWKEIYEIYAERAGLPLISSEGIVGQPSRTFSAAIVRAINRRPFLRQQAMKVLALASPERNQRTRAAHLVERARSEIGALRPAQRCNQALEWRETGSRFLSSLTPSMSLLADARYRSGEMREVARWPLDVPKSA